MNVLWLMAMVGVLAIAQAGFLVDFDGNLESLGAPQALRP
jgi:hypothetical protein